MATRYWVGGTGTWDNLSVLNWSLTSGGAGGATVPTASDTVIFDSASGTGVCTTASGSVCAVATLNSSTLSLNLGTNLTMSGTFTLTLGSLNINSNVLTCASFSSSNVNSRSIAFGTGSINLTGNNATVFNGGGGSTTAITITGTPTVNLTYSGSTGTRVVNAGARSILTAANTFSFNVSAGADTITLQNAGAFRSINFTGFSGTLSSNISTRVDIYGSAAFSSGMTITPATGVWTFTATSGTNTITTNGKTLDFPIGFDGVGGTWEFADALTQGSTRAFTITNGTVKLKAGATSTVGSFVTSGTNQKYLQSTTAGSQATLSDASGVNSVSYLTISDSFATGGATWDAFYSNGNVDAGNNTNWDFGATPVLGAEYEYKLRSFTEPRRF